MLGICLVSTLLTPSTPCLDYDFEIMYLLVQGLVFPQSMHHLHRLFVSDELVFSFTTVFVKDISPPPGGAAGMSVLESKYHDAYRVIALSGH